MSITAETAKQHANDPAVLCCRAEAGITIEPANLEDPAIFDDLVDSGLLNLEGVLTIEQVLGALVVGNPYMTNMVDNNKSESGIENEVLACNTLCKEEAVRAIAMLKAAMSGEEVKPAEKKWNSNVKANNIELIEKATGEKIELVANEQSLPMSQKRKEKYD